MKIDPCNITNINLYKSSPVFCSKPDNEITHKQTDEIPDVTKDYNTRTPIKYTYTGDIKLQDGIVAKCYKLASGQRVVIVPKSGSTIVKTYVNTGSFNEPDNLRGISHYIEHNLFNGSEEIGDEQFFDEVDKMGASTNASTSFANTDYYIKSSMLYDEDLENKIRLHAGMLTSPKFLTEKLEKEKMIVNSEINMYLSEDENIGFTQTVKNLFNINSTSKDLVAGSTDNITALTREDVVEYFNNNYYPGNMTTVVTGEVDPDKTIGLIAKYFNKTKAPSSQRKFEKMIPTEKAVRQDIISEKSTSGASTVLIGFSGPENNSKDNLYIHALSILASGLYDSRFSDIERTYGTGIRCETEKLSSRPSDRSMILLETRISEENTEQLISNVYKEINKLSQIPPTDKELQAVKNALKKDYDLTLETSSGLNHFIGSNLASERIDILKNYKKIIDEMTAEDIQQTAKKYLDLNKAALTVVHPNGTTSEMINNNYEQISQTKANNVSFTGAIHKTPINIDEIKTYRTYNNYEVVLNNSNSDTVQYKMAIGQTSWTPRKAATAEVLSDMLKYAGTKNHTIQQLSEEADLYAIDSSISAGDYGIGVYADFPAENTDKALNLFMERVLSPNFNEEELTASIRRLKDGYSRPDVNPYDKFMKKVYENTPLAYTTKDILESLDTITLNDVKDLYNELITTSQGKFVITGPFKNNPELKDQIFDSISKYPKVKVWDNTLEKIYTPIENTEVFTDINLKNQADILQGYRYKQQGNIKDNTCICLLNIIFGSGTASRLFKDLRETRHLAYHVSSSTGGIGDMGTFVLKIGTTTENKETGEKTFDNVEKAINGFNENIEKIKTEPVSDEELEAAKKQLKASILSSLETNSGKNREIGINTDTPYGLNYTNEMYNMIDSITAEDILNTANYIFSSKPIYSLTGTQETIEANKEFLDKLVK